MSVMQQTRDKQTFCRSSARPCGTSRLQDKATGEPSCVASRSTSPTGCNSLDARGRERESTQDLKSPVHFSHSLSSISLCSVFFCSRLPGGFEGSHIAVSTHTCRRHEPARGTNGLSDPMVPVFTKAATRPSLKRTKIHANAHTRTRITCKHKTDQWAARRIELGRESKSIVAHDTAGAPA